MSAPSSPRAAERWSKLLTDMADSYVITILEAIATRLSEIDGLPRIIRRKRAVRWDHDPKYITLISLISDECTKGAFQVSGGYRHIEMKYTVKIAVSYQNNNQYEEDDPQALAWREAIRQKMDQPRLPGADSVTEVNIVLGPVYDASAMNQTFDTVSLLCVLTSTEVANGNETVLSPPPRR